MAARRAHAWARLMAGFTLLAGGLPAQEPVRDSVAAADSVTESTRRLQRVVVTALRIPTELASATHAVARNDSDVTRRARPGLALGEALHGIPGVQVDNRYNFSLGERITVRGFGARTQFGVRGVRVLVDGIPATMPDGQTTLNHLDLGAIETVEAVRSPVASVYGNAAGGVILMTTAQPPLSRLALSSRVVSGSHELLRTQVDAGGTSGRSGYRIRAGRLEYDGFRAHNSAENRYFGARSATRLGSASLDVVLHHVRFDALNPGALPDSMVRSDPRAAFPTNVAQRTGQSGRHAQAGITLKQPLWGLQLTTAAYGLRRSFANPILPRIIDLSRRAGGVRVVLGTPDTAAGRVQWDAGVEAAGMSDDRLNHTNAGGERAALTLDQNERVRASAIFAAARVRTSERVTVQAGVRHDATRFEVLDNLISTGNPDDSGERKMRAWSPSIGVSAHVTDGARLFASLSTAFETPTTTELANRPDGAGGFNPDLRPQRSRAAEVGINGFASALWYQAAVYQARVTGSLVPFEVPGTPGRQFFRNAASARHQGAEMLLGAQLCRSLSARVAYTFTDARYRRYEANGSIYDGRRVPGVARHRVESLLRWSGPRAFADLESRYQAAAAVNDDNSAEVPGYTLHALRAGLEQVRFGSLALKPFLGMDNIFNRAHIASVTVNAAAGRYYEPGPPRTLFVGADAAVRWW